MKNIPLPVFILPFALLSALSVTELLGAPLRYIYSTTFLPGLIFGLGIYLHLKSRNVPVSGRFVFNSTLIYLAAYSLAYFVGIPTMGILSTPIAVLVGTALLFKLIFSALGISGERDKVMGWVTSILMSIAFGFAAFYLAATEPMIFRLIGSIETSYPLEAYMTEEFGSVLIGTQALIFVWQICMAVIINKLIRQKQNETTI